MTHDSDEARPVTKTQHQQSLSLRNIPPGPTPTVVKLANFDFAKTYFAKNEKVNLLFKKLLLMQFMLWQQSGIDIKLLVKVLTFLAMKSCYFMTDYVI